MRKILLNIFLLLKLLIFNVIISSLYAQESDALIKKGDSLYEKNNFSQAYLYFLEAFKKAELEKNEKNIAIALRAMGTCYYYQHDKSNALRKFYDYLKVVEKYDIDSLLSDAYYLVGVIYIEDQNLDSINKYIYPALELMKKEKNYNRLSRTYSALAELHINETKDDKKILNYLKLAQQYADSIDRKQIKAFAATKHYNYYFRNVKDYNKALYYVSIAESLLQECGDHEGLMNAYRGKAECLIMLRDTLAKDYIYKWFLYKDSIFDLQKANDIAKYEEQFEAEKKEAENKQLTQQNEIRNRTIFILILILLLLVFLGLWWINRSNVKKKQQQLQLMQKAQKEKERIARDLHDNVGGQLSYLITNLEWLANHPEFINNTEELKKRLLNFSETGRNAILTLCETIWAVNNEKLSIIDFTDRFKNYVLKLQISESIKINFIEKFEKPENVLMPEQALNIFRICQEAFHNALKHSKATTINLYFESSESCLFKFTVEDNGIGFDYQNRYKDGHYGMKNMEERAKESNAEISIKSEINNGTKISICVKYTNANEVL
jgi:signal transduction histidine kinase